MALPRATVRQPIPLPRILLVGSLLCLCAASLSIMRFLLNHSNGRPHQHTAETIVFSKVPLVLLPAAAGPLIVLTLLILAIRWSWRREPGRGMVSIALALSVLGHQALLVSSFLPPESWSAEDYVTGQDGTVYYFLHCPPPMNGPGHYAVARRVSGNPWSYTVQTVGQFDRHGTFTPYSAASPQPRVAAKVLWSHWKSGKQHSP